MDCDSLIGKVKTYNRLNQIFKKLKLLGDNQLIKI